MDLTSRADSDSPVSTWAYVPVWVAVWSSLILLDIANDLFQAQFYDVPEHGLTWMVQEWTAFWGIWILVSLAIAPAVQRFNPDRVGWRRTLAAHAVVSLVLTSVQLCLAAMAFQAMDRDSRTYADRLSGYFFSFTVRSLLIYWTLLGALLAWNYWLRARAKEVETARLQARAAQLELLISETQLATLRRDLNPHFLFNALNGISGLVRSGKNDTAVEMIAGLGRLLRLSMEGSPTGLVQLREEVESLEQYLYIEGLRFGDRLQVDWDLSSDTLGLSVPSFVLQPIVENAVIHGVGGSKEAVTITIRSRMDDAGLMLEVEDSGPGPGSAREGTGLANTKARLTLLYGDGATVALSSVSVGGTLVRINIPSLSPKPVREPA